MKLYATAFDEKAKTITLGPEPPKAVPESAPSAGTLRLGESFEGSLEDFMGDCSGYWKKRQSEL